jgi:uncharacterized delta-60 repeat protein
MKRIIFMLSFLLLGKAELLDGSYSVGNLDTTANGGTGFGNATPGSATGYIQSSFLASQTLTATASAVQPDGKIVVVGSTATGSSPAQKAVVSRYNINGALDTATFNAVGYQTQLSPTLSSNYNVILNDVVVQPDGKIVVVGSATALTGGKQSLLIARLQANGIADATFNADGTPKYVLLNLGDYIENGTSIDTATAVVLDAQGNIIVTGSTQMNQFEGSTTNNIFVVKYNTDGVLQTSFNPGAVVGGTNISNAFTAAGIGLISMSAESDVTANGIGIDANGKIVVVGSNDNDMFVARFLNTGVLDTNNFANPNGYLGFAISISNTAYGVGFQSSEYNNRIIVAGQTNGSAFLAGFTNAGALDTAGFGADIAPGVTRGYTTNGWTGTNPIAYGLQIQSDDSIVFAGSSNQSGGTSSFVIDFYSADGFQTNFISTDIAEPSFGRGLSMQQNGSFILAGTVGTGATKFATARYLGTPVEGAMDLYYNASDSNAGWSVNPTVTATTGTPGVVAMYPLSGSNAGDLYVATTGADYSQISQINAAGAIVGLPATLWYGGAALYGVIDIIADANNRAVTIGSTDGSAYIIRYTNVNGAMTLDTSFGGGVVLDGDYASSFMRVAQQSTGNYITIGQAYNPYNYDGVLHSFDENGNPGIDVYINNAFFCDVLIDADNYIYVAYQNNASSGTGFGNICIAKYVPNGSVYDTTFGTSNSGILDTGWTVGQNSEPCLTFDNQGNVVVAVSNSNDGIYIQAFAPNSTGTPAYSCNIPQSTSLLSNPVLRKLQCDTYDTYGRLVFTGYDDNNFFVARMYYDGTYFLDNSFAPYSTCKGILKVNYNDVNPHHYANTVCINPNGAILFGGYEVIAEGSTVALVGQVIGHINEEVVATQVNRFPAGASDGTLVNGTPFDINTSASLNGQPRAIYTFDSGTFNGYTLMVTTNGTTAILSMLDATTYALNTSSQATSFNDGAGQVTLGNIVNAISMLVDVAGNIYVLGTDSDNIPLVCKVSSDGIEQTSIYPILRYYDETTPVYALDSAYGMVQQASGRILICGWKNSTGITTGVIAAINPYLNDGAGGMDLSFNPNFFAPGCFLLGPGSNPITAIAVGETDNSFGDADKIYFAGSIYTNNQENLYTGIARLLENGTQFDPDFNTGQGYWINDVIDPTQIRMQINSLEGDAYINLFANTYNGIQGICYNRSNGNLDTEPFVIIPSLLTPTLQEILCLTDGTILVLSSNGSTLDIARVTWSFEADTSFNPGGLYPGVLNTTVGSEGSAQNQFWAVDVLGNGDQGIIVASDTNSDASLAVPYLTQVVNSSTVSKYPQTASATPTPGILDTTFNAPGYDPGTLNLNVELPNNFLTGINQVGALLQNANGSYYIGGTGLESYITLMSDDDVQNTEFGVVQLESSAGTVQSNLSDMFMGQNNNLFIVGSTSASGWLQCLDATTGEIPNDFIRPIGSGNTLSHHYAIAQQSDGRLLVAGDINNVAAIIAYNPITGAVDTTFGNNGIATFSGYSAINDILVDGDDTIYIIMNETTGGYNSVVRCFNSTGTIGYWGSGVLSESTNPANNHIAFNQDGNVVAVGCNSGQTTVVTFAAGPTGGNHSTFIFLNEGNTGITTPNVTSISVDLNAAPGKIILTGFDSSTNPTTPFILRLQANLSGLDTTFTSGSGTAGVVTTNDFEYALMYAWSCAMINANGKITVGGSALIEGPNCAYLMRVYGDEFIGQYEQPVAAGTPGTINANFPNNDPTSQTAGYLTLQTSSIGQPTCVLPLANGSQYVGFSDGTIVRYTNENILDTSFGPEEDGYAAQALDGLSSMIIDGNGCLVVVGTLYEEWSEPFAQGWIVRYENGNSGQFDTTFNGGNTLYITNCQAANTVIEQSLSRLIIAGQLDIPENIELEIPANTNGALFGLTNTGAPDVTFSIYSQSGVGVADSGVASPLYALVADQYDRLLVAGLLENQVGISRLTSFGEYDQTFGDYGIIYNIFSNVSDPSQVKIALDANNNIVVAANTDSGISAVAYENNTGTTLTIYYSDYLPLSNPTLTGIVATADGNILLKMRCG